MKIADKLEPEQLEALLQRVMDANRVDREEALRLVTASLIDLGQVAVEVYAHMAGVVESVMAEFARALEDKSSIPRDPRVPRDGQFHRRR